MPPFRQPQSLYSLCLDTMLLCLRSARDTRNKYNPLVNLPAFIIEEIMEAAFLAGCWAGKIDWKIFFVPQIKHIILFNEMTDLKNLLGSCKKLRKVTLVIGVGQSVSLDDINSYLKSTNVLCTIRNVDDYVMNNAHLQCRPDVVRNMSSVSWIWSLRESSFMGMLEPVCNIFDSTNRPVELYLPYVDISVEDIKWILQIWPWIKVLRHKHLVSAMYLLHGTEDTTLDHTSPKYQLRNLDMEFTSIKTPLETRFIAETAVQLAVDLCPNASAIKIISGNVIPKGLFQHFLNLDNIQELNVNGEFVDSDLDVEIRTFLEIKGRNIKRLELRCINTLNCSEVIAQCPYLEHLNLEMNIHHSLYDDGCVNELKHLQVLSISRCSNFSSSFWQSVLASRRLTRIFLLSVNLEPKILKQLIQENRWENLSFLSLVCCINVELSHIMALLRGQNNLCFLVLNKFGNINEKARRKVETYIRKRGLDIKFRYI